ncbi:MAG TPA: L-seryl-tRNA(Sec) selenium transferase [Solirubrobacteraceae bacterium]|nr:L-seryl-tRNA(Sec) selenium transferase [Solirubrobacteraceae bacterium]
MDAPELIGDRNAQLRSLPSVGELAAALQGDTGDALAPPAVSAARETIERRRAELLAGAGDPGDAREPIDLLERARALLRSKLEPALRGVINATGVVVHTNLGRAPLAEAAAEAAGRLARGYSNLELDLTGGRRGSRHDHVEDLLCELTGAQAAMAVNNCAGAVLLAAAAFGGPGSNAGRSIVVSRGQLVEIGGAFRIPEVVAVSGARLVEVGTTNRTRLADYEAALSASENHPVGAILRVHPSNFRTVGFVEEVGIEDLCGLAAAHGVAVIDDVGSGVLADELAVLADEPAVRRSVAAGADVVCFSGDKLLGGPQAGVIVGRAGAVKRLREHPLARALRIDKLCLAALEATLRLYREPARARREIPVLAMLEADPRELRARAERLRDLLQAGGVPAELVEASARVGGGALPLVELHGPAVAVGAVAGGAVAGVDELAERLRAASPVVLGRISRGRLLLDPRTMTDPEVDAAAKAAVAALTA